MDCDSAVRTEKAFVYEAKIRSAKSSSCVEFPEPAGILFQAEPKLVGRNPDAGFRAI